MKRHGVLKQITALLVAWVLSVSAFFTFFEKITADAAENTTIYNDTFWKDTSGNNIYSQGGGVFKFGDTYYWYGVHYYGAETYAASPTKKNDDTAFKAVTCYSSKDLVNWKFENNVLTSESSGFPWCYWFGRLGVAYNQNTGKYVLVAQHNESVLFASCDSPTGNFKVENIQDQITNVLKQGTGDQTIFVDDDGQAYLICSNKGGRGHQYVSKLRESDFLYAEPAVEVAKGSGREGNCLFKYKGKYYFCASDLHGWNASHSYYMVADNITGPYSAWKVMDGTDEDFSYVTQTGFFVTVKGTKQETVLYCGDRWSDFAGNGIGYNQWVPLTIDGDNVKFNSLSEWNLNAETGEWSIGAGNNYCLNPTFEADRVSQTTLAGWKASGTGNSNKKGGRTGNWCAQQYDANAYTATLTQDLTVPNGTYNLKAWVKSSGGQNTAIIYTRTSEEDKIVNVGNKINDWTQVAIDGVKVADGKVQIGIYSDANAGNWLLFDDFTLIGDGVNPTPVTPEPEKIPDGELIKSLVVNDSDNYSDWSIQQGLTAGSSIFGDRTFTFTSVPEQLNDAEWIQSACDSKKYKGVEAEFTAGADITAFVGLDTRVEPVPEWLSDWVRTDLTLTDDGNPIVTYNVYQKDVKSGETVTLGELNMANTVNYVAMAKPYDPDAVYTKPVETEPVKTEPTETEPVETEPTKTEPVEPEPTAFISGDINDDKKVNGFDMALMRQGLLEPMTDARQLLAADMNSDGDVNVSDAVILQKFLLGIQ